MAVIGYGTASRWVVTPIISSPAVISFYAVCLTGQSADPPLLIGPLSNMLLQSPFVADKIIIRMEGQYKEVCKLHSDRSVAFVSDWPTEETTEREEIHSLRCAGGSFV